MSVSWHKNVRTHFLSPTAQCSAVQCGAVQCSAVQCSIMQCSAGRCSAVQCSILQCRAVLHYVVQRECNCEESSRPLALYVSSKSLTAGTAATMLQFFFLHERQCSAVQCSAVQCSAVQCSAVQYSALHCIALQCCTDCSKTQDHDSKLSCGQQ